MTCADKMQGKISKLALDSATARRNRGRPPHLRTSLSRAQSCHGEADLVARSSSAGASSGEARVESGERDMDGEVGVLASDAEGLLAGSADGACLSVALGMR